MHKFLLLLIPQPVACHLQEPSGVANTCLKRVESKKRVKIVRLKPPGETAIYAIKLPYFQAT